MQTYRYYVAPFGVIGAVSAFSTMGKIAIILCVIFLVGLYVAGKGWAGDAMRIKAKKTRTAIDAFLGIDRKKEDKIEEEVDIVEEDFDEEY